MMKLKLSAKTSGCLTALWLGVGFSAGAADDFITNPVSLAGSGAVAYSQGLLRMSRAYVQGADGAVVVDAAEPSRFISENSTNPQATFAGKDKNTSNGRYVSYLKRGWYELDIARKARLVVWFRGYYHSIGHWNHDEYLDNAAAATNNSDSNATKADDPALNRWIWKKGATYDFTPGKHVFSLDWQGGVKLDQIAFLPEGVAPKDNASPTYAPGQGAAEVRSNVFKLADGQKALRLVFDAMLEGGDVEAEVSTDGGKAWRPVPRDGVLASLNIPGGASLTFKLKLSLSPGKGSPSVFNLGLLTTPPSNDNVVSGSAKDKLRGVGVVELIPSTWKGARPDDKGWSLMSVSVPDKAGAIWLDAVKADNLILSPKQKSWVMADKDAVHGQAVYQGVLNRNLLSFDFQAPENGKYRPWLRVKLHGDSLYKGGIGGFKGLFGVDTPYIPLMYQVDNGNLVEYSGEKPFPKEGFLKKDWVWVPCPALSVDAGCHTFRVRAGLDYMLFDRVALVPERSTFAPSGKGGEAVKRQAAAAELVFQPLGWPSSRNIEEIAAEGATNVDTVYFYSTDGVKWHDAATGIKSVPGKKLWLKATLTARDKGQRAAVSSWTAKLPGAAAKALELADGSQSLWFDPATGALLGWHAEKAGWLVPFGDPQQVFNLSMSSAGESVKSPAPVASDSLDPVERHLAGGLASAGLGKFPVPVSFRLAKMEMAGKTLQMRFDGNNGELDALVEVSLAGGGLPRWSLKIANKSTCDIRNLEFPLLRNLRLGNDPEGTYGCASFPNFGGTGFTAAPYQIASPGVGITGFQVGMKGVYPGWHSMGWDSLYTQRHGAFTGQVRDSDGVGVLMSLEKDAESTAMKLSYTRKLYVGPGETGAANYAVGWHAGDWHASADLYSEWAHSWMDFSRVNANWAKDSDGWVPSAWYYDSTYIPTRFATHLVPELQWLGCLYFQHFSGLTDFGFCSAFPYPSPKLGTPEEYRKGHGQSREQGVHHSYYWNCRGWSDNFADSVALSFTPRSMIPPEIEIPPRGFAARNSVKSEDGKMAVYGYYPKDSSMCAASKGWNDFLVKGISYNYGEFLGASVYSDEACGYWDCFDASHGHGKQHGMYMKGLQEAYRAAIDAARKSNPDFILAIEGCPDQLLQYADFAGFGLSCYADGVSYQYTFPEAKLLRGVCNPGGQWFMPLDEYTRFIHLYNRFDTHPDSPLKRQFFAHRKRIGDWMHMRRFMDDVNLEISKPGIIAKWFKTDGDGRAGALVNIQNEFGVKDASLRLDWAELNKAKLATAYLLEEEEAIKLDMKADKGGVTVAIPAAKASSILIAAEFPEEEALRAFVVWPQTAGKDKLSLFLANLSSDKKEVSLSYELPEGVTLENAPAEVMVEGGSVRRVDIPLDGVQNMSKQDKVVVEVDGKELSCLLAPTLCNRGFELDSAGKGTPDRWRAFGQYWTMLLLESYVPPFDLNQADGVLDPENPAEGKYSLKLYGSVDLPNCGPAASKYKTVIDKPVQTLPWYFHTGQRMILKPNAKYLVSFKYRFAADDGVLEARPSAPGPVYGIAVWQRIEAKPGVREWQETQFTITSYGEQLFVVANMSKSPLWLDDVKITEIKK